VWDDTEIGGPNDRFPATQFSLIEAAAATGLAGEALESIASIYWKPVYRFIRLKFGKNNEDAKDLTQSFFASALERDFLGRFEPQRGSFRTYVRMAVERFASTEQQAATRQKRGGGLEFESVADQAAGGESPERIFEREWQRRLFELGIEDLRAHCEGCGKQVQFAVFLAHDLGDERPSYKDLAIRHGIAETAVTNHLAWARRTLRGFVNARLRGVTASDREFRSEMRRIWI